MSTFPACEAPIRAFPGDAARADHHQSRKRPFPDGTVGGRTNDMSPHVSKKSRTDNSPNEPEAQSPSPSPWPMIDYHIPDEHSSKPMLREWENDVHEAVDRSEADFREARQEYTKFRKNRLPSPAPSNEESVVGDSDTDEFGCCPVMLNLENDDPEVEVVFGDAYAQRIRRRSRPPAPPIRPQKVFSPPPIQQSEEDTLWTQKIVKPRGNVSQRRTQAPGLRYSTRLRKVQTDDRKMRPPGMDSRRARRSSPRPSEMSSNIPERYTMDEFNKQSSFGQRLTRRSRQPILYELDRSGKPRVVSVNCLGDMESTSKLQRP